MLTGIVGNIVPFDPAVCRFSVYISRFRQFLAVNSIVDAKHVPTFLTVIGDAHFQLLVNLLAPDDPATRTLDQLIAALEAHFEPATLEVAERQKFYNRRQAENESISAFVADLRRLSLTCRFGAHLQSALRDQFIAGIRSDATKRRLLTTADLTFPVAVQTAQQFEAADRDIASVLHSAPALSSSSSVANVQGPSGHKKFQKKSGKKPHQGNNGNAPSASTTKQNPPGKPGKKKGACHRCGKFDHWAPDCPHIHDTCHKCGKKGHLAAVCRGKASGPSNSNIHSIIGDIGAVFHSSSSLDAISIDVVINSKSITMELDTGASRSLLTEEHWKEIGSPKLIKADAALRAYGGPALRILGYFNANVSVKGSTATVPLLVVHAPSFPSLFGRDWLMKFQLDWPAIFKRVLPKTEIHSVSLADISSQYSDLFSSELGHVKNVKAHIEMRPDAVPKFFKPRPVPFALKPKIEADLDRLLKLGVIEPVMRSDWAAPIVPVLKPDGSVRICGDFRLTINPAIQTDWYPLPNTEDLFASLSGCTVFSKLDLSDAYLQIELEESAKQYVVINTHKGLFRYNRLPFGVSFAPALFQNTIEKITQGLEGTPPFLDDLIVGGRDQQEHDQRLHAVLKRFRENGLRLKLKKCEISKHTLEYLAHVLSADGIRPSPEKVKAILNSPKPSDPTGLRAFLGIVNYYGNYIQNLATVAAPLYALLKKSTEWNWSKACENSFNALRHAITADSVLVPYNSKVPLVLDCDASSFGIGAVLSHVMPDGSHRPIAFASKSLAPAEKNYSQIEREALALIFGVKKFHRYLFARKFELVTDHKPLLMVMGPKGHIASVSASRLHRWAVILSAYDFSLKFRPTQQHGNADYLSRFPIPDSVDSCLDDSVIDNVEVIAFLDDISESPLTHKQVRIATLKDPLLTEVMRYVQSGWPFESHCPVPALQPFYLRRQELSISNDCLLWNLRLVIPATLRSAVLKSLHECHSGIVRMKSLARSYIWWPGIDSEIEEIAKSCITCAEVQAAPAKAPLHPWAFPERPWQRVHVDFCGPVFNCDWLVLVDAYTKWPEVIHFTSPPTSATLIEALRSIFARFGLCEELVSDNGPQFTSQLFASFLKKCGIRHRLTAPYHPASNGEAERFVRTFKEGMKQFGKEGDWKYNVQRFMFSYRVTPHATTGRTPAELMFGRQLRTTWDLLRPSIADTVESALERQKSNFGGKDRSFATGDLVWVRDYRGSKRWVPGEIVEVLGPRNFRVRTSIGTWKRHMDQLRLRSDGTTPTELDSPILLPFAPPPLHFPAVPSTPASPALPIDAGPLAFPTPPAVQPATPVRRYPQRQTRPPDRFTPG